MFGGGGYSRKLYNPQRLLLTKNKLSFVIFCNFYHMHVLSCNFARSAKINII